MIRASFWREVARALADIFTIAPTPAPVRLARIRAILKRTDAEALASDAQKANGDVARAFEKLKAEAPRAGRWWVLADECPGRGECHGAQRWCDVCGDDAAMVCPDPVCDAHGRGKP